MMSWYEYSTCEKVSRGNASVNIQSQFGSNNLITVTLEDKGVLRKQKSGITSTFL